MPVTGSQTCDRFAEADDFARIVAHELDAAEDFTDVRPRWWIDWTWRWRVRQFAAEHPAEDLPQAPGAGLEHVDRRLKQLRGSARGRARQRAIRAGSRWCGGRRRKSASDPRTDDASQLAISESTCAETAPSVSCNQIALASAPWIALQVEEIAQAMPDRAPGSRPRLRNSGRAITWRIRRTTGSPDCLRAAASWGERSSGRTA